MLSFQVFNSGYRPIPSVPGWGEATWPAGTATLIRGEREAILVDALLTVDEGERLAAWVRESGRDLRAVFLTHGHFDHFFGAGPVLGAYAGSRLIACDQQVVDEAVRQTGAEVMARWNALFPGRLAATPPVPSWSGAANLDLEGNPVYLRTIGGADGVLATIAYVPDLRLVCAGDIVYNNIHMWLRNSTPESRKAWLASLDAVATMKPVTVVTGHRDPDAPDDDAARVIDQSRRYIEDFERELAVSGTARELIDRMLARYPDHGNRYTLFASATSQFA
ncbi:MBL fold metallo-hydrolase [Paractinoplanes globisporus]|uniref:MBL fold metallo-hydrolase n=1 Tax=Paractinoplanes globisporus TaxID=113565 RepID=A0ABW6WVZ3_9ACTN|nr:MBL fold metallo-hydrolase [Actinoplanes globisporus]